MGLFSKRPDVAGSGHGAKSVVAASLPLEGPNKVRVGRNFKAGQDDWQNESWYFYDAVGEYRSALTWVANAVSKADVHAAELDPETGTAGEPTEDARVQQIASAVLGGFEQRPQHLKTLAQQWQVAGESFIIVRPTGAGKPDEWLVLSGRRVIYKGSKWTYVSPSTLETVTLTPRELLMRVWSPHPDDPVKADSAGRPALPILREIEKSTQHIAATLDSRIGTAGIMPVPSELNFPTPDGISKAQGFTDYLHETISANLKNPGQAAARVPVVAEMPGEMIAAFSGGFMDLATAFDGQVVELRQASVQRLAATLDMPNETAEGSTGGMNHWGAWQVEESTYKIYIEPLLEAIGNALTIQWFRPALAAAGIANPERYTLAWDMSSIISRPDRTGELNELYDKGLISADYLRSQQGIPDDAIPDEEELQLSRLERIVIGAPTLAADPEIARRLFGFEIAPAAFGSTPAAAGLPGGDAEGEPDSRALPAAVDADEPPEGLVAAAEFAVFDALSRAGKRLLTRQHRGQFADTPAERLYLEVPHDKDPTELLEGSFAFISETDYPGLTSDLRMYTRRLLSTRTEYQRATLKAYLR